jgi:hypothetical protein
MNIDQIVTNFIEHLTAGGVACQRIDSAPWIAEFEAKLPRRLPRSFFSLVTRYCFPSFELAEIEFFANRDGQADDELVVAAFRDKYLWRPAFTQGFVHIGKSSTGSYDPICFDMRDQRPGQEYPLVRLNHEELLQKERIRIVEEIAESFLALIVAEAQTG